MNRVQILDASIEDLAERVSAITTLVMDNDHCVVDIVELEYVLIEWGRKIRDEKRTGFEPGVSRVN